MVDLLRYKTTLATPSDREIVLTRDFPAPRSLVFEAWSKPEHLRRWWGMRSMQLVVCEVDFRVGGAFRLDALKSDGSHCVLKGIYQEIVRPERIVFEECYEDEALGDPKWINTISFVERGGVTTLTSVLLHPSTEARDGHRWSGMEAGVAETFDRLEIYLGALS